MSGVCKACDKVLSTFEMQMREVTIEGGKKMKVQEDLCKSCRDRSYISYYDDTNDVIIEALQGKREVNSKNWEDI
jgi:hypothetical protein